MPEKRKYELKKRAERQNETRLRITKAAVELHGTIGPAKTTISAIAERAGVERLTVYRHFPDERALFEACSKYGRERMPPPDPEPWKEIAEPEERLRTALTELYAYFRRTEPFWVNVLRDAEVMPIVKEMAVKRRLGYLSDVRDLLAAGWRVRGRRRSLLVAAIGHAVDFRTWESLARRQGLEDRQIVELMTSFIACLVKP
jgi:AcrR family transcriptional regulator